MSSGRTQAGINIDFGVTEGGVFDILARLEREIKRVSTTSQGLAEATGETAKLIVEGVGKEVDRTGKTIPVTFKHLEEFITKEQEEINRIKERDEVVQKSLKNENFLRQVKIRSLKEELKTADLGRTRELSRSELPEVRAAAEARILRARRNFLRIEKGISNEKQKQVAAAARASKEEETMAIRRQQRFAQRALGASSLLFGLSQELGFAGLNVGFAAMAGPQFAAAAATVTAIGSLSRTLIALGEEAKVAADNLNATSVSLTRANRERERELGLLGVRLQNIRASRMQEVTERQQIGAIAAEEFGISNIKEEYQRQSQELGGAIAQSLNRIIQEGFMRLGANLGMPGLPGFGTARTPLSQIPGFESPQGLTLQEARIRAANESFMNTSKDRIEALEIEAIAVERATRSSNELVRLDAEKRLKEIVKELRGLADIESSLSESFKAREEIFNNMVLGAEKLKDALTPDLDFANKFETVVFGMKENILSQEQLHVFLEASEGKIRDLKNDELKIQEKMFQTAVKGAESLRNALFPEDAFAKKFESMLIGMEEGILGLDAIDRFMKGSDALKFIRDNPERDLREEEKRLRASVERAEALRDRAFPEEEFARMLDDLRFGLSEGLLSREGVGRILFREAVGLRGEPDKGFQSQSSSLTGFFDRRFSAALSREPKEDEALKALKDATDDQKEKLLKAFAAELGVLEAMKTLLEKPPVARFGGR